MRIGRILLWWVILFLFSYMFLQLPQIAQSLLDQGTTINEVIPTILVAGLVIISLLDGAIGD